MSRPVSAMLSESIRVLTSPSVETFEEVEKNDSTAKRGINQQRNKPKAGLKRMAKEPGTAEKGTQKQK